MFHYIGSITKKKNQSWFQPSVLTYCHILYGNTLVSYTCMCIYKYIYNLQCKMRSRYFSSIKKQKYLRCHYILLEFLSWISMTRFFSCPLNQVVKELESTHFCLIPSYKEPKLLPYLMSQRNMKC